MKFDQQFLTGLYLFLRMLQLSFDRALGGEWKNLIEFLATQPTCREVVSSISTACGYDVVPKMSPRLPSTPKTVLSRNTLTKDELAFTCWWLIIASELVERDDCEPTDDEIANVRLNLANAEQIVRSRFVDRDQFINRDQSIYNVEHFNQNEMIACRPINEILGGPWPN